MAAPAPVTRAEPYQQRWRSANRKRPKSLQTRHFTPPGAAYLWYGPGSVRGRSGRHALQRAALASAALAAVLVPAAGGAGSAGGLREQAQSLQEQRTSLARSEHGALLALYAAEASLSRAQAESARRVSHTVALERQQRSARRRAALVRRSLEASQERVARTLRALYMAGDPDPIAVVLGAASLDEVITGIESLQRATAQNRRLAREARARAEQLSALQAQLKERRAAAARARDEAIAAANSLARAVAERRATVDEVRSRLALADRRLDALQEQARAATEATAAITRAGAPATQPSEDTSRSTDRADDAPSPAPVESVVPPAGETRTLVVDAVAYHLPGRTASGLPVGPGIVAVDPRVIPLGTRLFIPGYGPGIAADTGTAIKGNIIDLWMPSTAAALRWGRRTVTITIYG
jgi:3D (Asp-Asp-Asp) domain-containing protein